MSRSYSRFLTTDSAGHRAGCRHELWNTLAGRRIQPYNKCTCVYTETIMATKTITIDVEAYRRLKGAKKADESFSQAIKRIVKPPFDVERWLKRIREDGLSEDALAAVERQVARRHTGRRRDR